LDDEVGFLPKKNKVYSNDEVTFDDAVKVDISPEKIKEKRKLEKEKAEIEQRREIEQLEKEKKVIEEEKKKLHEEKRRMFLLEHQKTKELVEEIKKIEQERLEIRYADMERDDHSRIVRPTVPADPEQSPSHTLSRRSATNDHILDALASPRSLHRASHLRPTPPNRTSGARLGSFVPSNFNSSEPLSSPSRIQPAATIIPPAPDILKHNRGNCPSQNSFNLNEKLF